MDAINRSARPIKILVVDDYVDLLPVVATMVEALGYDVLTAGSATHALALLRVHRDIDVLFTDVRMPDMSGLVLVERALQLHPTLRILLTTGYADDSEGDVNLMDRYPLIRKPYRLDDLGKQLHLITAAISESADGV